MKTNIIIDEVIGDKIIELCTDGACSGNPGPGSWACIRYDKNDNCIYDAYMGYEDKTTNNRMEITGLLKALELARTKYKENVCLIYCDSAYCVNMFNEWISNWASNNWINSSKQEVKNLDLVKQLYEYKKIDFPNFQIIKVKGHEGDIGNELADAYAAAAKVSTDTTKLVKIIKENDITLAIE